MFSRATWLAVAALLIAGISGCGVVQKINNVRHAVDANQSAVQALTQGLKAGEATAFSATYVTMGSTPTAVTTYAVQPPTDVTFREAASGSATAQLALISNANGEYSCTSDRVSTTWSCQKLGRAQAVAQNELADIYTPSHWLTYLKIFSTAAGLAGVKVTQSSMTVNGFSMNCVNFRAKDTQGISTICTTSQNILGYVKVAGVPTSFELKTYSTSPAASLFQLPAGAKVTTAG